MHAWIDKRLRQTTGRLDIPLGEPFSYIDRRLWPTHTVPPVGDAPLHSPTPTSDLGCLGHAVYQLFTTVVTLTQVLRQAGVIERVDAFKKLLMYLRNGNFTNDD